MNLLPEVKSTEIRGGFLSKKYISPFVKEIDYRLKKAIDKLPVGEDGAELIIDTKGGNSEKYVLEISEDSIKITSDGLNGAFYGIQTLRQILRSGEIPCLRIEDEPDFEYRGLYHDITRGKVPRIETIKKLIDDMAYFKMNSLQLYVEHTFEFEETKDLIKKTGYISKDEIKELDRYCHDNFIEFIPSIATFGHMYEILEQDEYKHLRVCKEVATPENFWRLRMVHHTIDPENEESIKLVKSLIDQYSELFESDKFNICGDETFDLENCGDSEKAGRLYLEFIKKVIDIVKAKNKKVMMWADIILKHPEIMGNLSDDIYYLNWAYSEDPSEEKVIAIAKSGKKQIVCPGTSSWSRFCENVGIEEKNITKLIDYGYKHGAVGVLNTNWGDYGNPASIEMAMYGIVLGAVKSWTVKTVTDESFYEKINDLLYGGKDAMTYLRKISDAHSAVAPTWNRVCLEYFKARYGEVSPYQPSFFAENAEKVQKECINVIKALSSEKWEFDEAREEMILCAEGICVIAQLGAKLFGVKTVAVVDAMEWLKKYKEKWLLKNKESEISKIEEMISYVDSI